MRQTEQRAAAAKLGVKDVIFLEGHVDGELTVNRRLLGDIVRVIRKLKPYAVFTHEPQQVFHNNAFINHNDHRATGMTTIDAIYPTARDRLNFPEHLDEGLDVHNVKRSSSGATTTRTSQRTLRTLSRRKYRRCCSTRASSAAARSS